MEALLNFLNIDQLLAAYGEQKQAFPREVSLAEVAIMASLAVTCGLLLLWGVLRRNGTALVGGSLLGVTALVEAYAFGQFAFMSPAVGLILQGIYISIGLAFVTATVRIAKDNMVLGSALLLVIISALALAAVGAADIFAAGPILKLGLVGVAGFAVLISLYQGTVGGDRLALAVAPGFALMAAALIAAPLISKMATPSWLMTILPHLMLSSGVLLSVLIGTLGGRMSPGQIASGAAAAGAGIMSDRAAEPLHAKGAQEPIYEPEMPAKKGLFGGRNASSRQEPRLDAPDFVTDLNAEEDPRPYGDEAMTRAPAPAGRRSTASSLWGRRSSDAGGQSAPASGDWDWSPEGISASSALGAAFGLAAQDLEPAMMRDLVAERSLDAFDEAILGGETPRSGPFTVMLDLTNGANIELRGFREVDRDGLVSRLTADAVANSQSISAPQAASSPPQMINTDEVAGALARGEFRTYFQPIIRLEDEDVVGFEALARWHRGDRVVEAEEFIDAIVDAGFGLDLTQIILADAARELADWCAAAPDKKPFVTVNVSQRELLNDQLVKLITNTVKQSNLQPGALVIEMTERNLADQPGKLMAVVKGLRAAGCSLALDDFGAGHSNLSTLSKFKFDILKTDKSLLHKHEQGQADLVNAVEIARKLGIALIAEGIETQALAASAKQAQCGLGQGFYFGRPAPADGGEPAEMDAVPLAPQAPMPQAQQGYQQSRDDDRTHRPQSVVPNLR
ncbi:MAG: EAL domain-containing protein [Parvularculaceae bacterium]